MSDIRQACIGRWYGILSALGVDESYLTRRNGPCIFCAGTDRWRWTDHNGEGRWICNHCGHGDGFDLLMRLNGWDFATTAKEIEDIIGAVKDEPRQKSDPSLRIVRIKEGLIKSHADVTAYLASRSLKQPAGIVAHPSLGYFEDGKRVADYPAMVGGVQSRAGDLVTLHVTYLKAGRKAPVTAPRKMLTPRASLDGAAIRLYPAAEHMGVAEGIETALSAARLFRLPVWSLVNTTLMEKWVPPAGVYRVTIFADHDANYAGHKAAYALAFRLVNDGLEVDVQVPEEIGDWNDVLVERLRAAEVSRRAQGMADA